MADTKNGKQAAAAQAAPANGPAATKAASQAGGKAKGKRGRRKKMSKMEAVRKALSAMGREAKPSQLKPFIRSEYGIDMTTDHISTYKGDILRKEAKAKAAAASQEAPAEKPAASRSRGAASSEGTDAILLEDVLTARALLDRVGAEKLRT